MKVTQVTYRMLRVTRQYENDTTEAVVQVEDGEDVQAAFDMARKECDDAITKGRDASLREKLKRVMESKEGREALDAVLRRF